VHFALQRGIRHGFNRESGKKGRVHCLEPDAFGCSPLVTNSANTSAQRIDKVIMAAFPNRAHLRSPRIAATQGSIAICERHVPKMSLARAAAIRQTASVYAPADRAGLAPSCNALNFSCGYHATATRRLGKTIFLFSACARGMVICDRDHPPSPRLRRGRRACGSKSKSKSKSERKRKRAENRRSLRGSNPQPPP
jgi:hypothetical protein